MWCGAEKYAREIHKAGIYARNESSVGTHYVRLTYTHVVLLGDTKIQRVNASTALARRELMKNSERKKRNSKI